MKKIIVFVLLCTVFLQTSLAYSPSTDDLERIEKLNEKLTEIIDGDREKLWDFYTQLRDIQDYFITNDRLNYMAGELKESLHRQLQQIKQPYLLEAKVHKRNFVDEYAGNIIKEHTIPQRCRDRWQFLDDISFVHNLPTAITIATWYAETTCGFYLPIHPTYGSNGPFQIITKDYGTGDMTEPLFRQTVKDFVDFTRSKINSYERANRAEGLEVNLRYIDFDWTGVVRKGALYNGLSGRTLMGDIQPMKRWYVFNNYEDAYSGAVRHGLMPMFIKSLERELENIYPQVLGNMTGVF